MWTSWHQATRITETQLDQIGYADGQGLLDQPRNLITVLPLRGIHTGTGALIIEQARALKFDCFNFSITGTVMGIELRLNTQRLSRIQDNVIQLSTDQLLGENRAVDSAEDLQHYGSASDMWGINSTVDFNSDLFGVVVDLQPHKTIPSNNPAIIYTLDLRLWVI
jgi:hypothetical protein